MTELVVCSVEPWDEVWRRNQYLIAGLLDRDPELTVLFVEPPVDPLYEVWARRRPRPARGLVRRYDVADGRLWTLQETELIPRGAGRFAEAALTRGVIRAARRLHFDEPMLWINDPSRAALVQRTGWPALYDITDDWLRADRPARELRRLARNEWLLLRQCREVVVCSPGLQLTKGEQRSVTLIGNGVDVPAYRRPAPRPKDLPDGPCAVYVGTLLDDRLDVELCVQVARALAGTGELVLIGPDGLSARSRALLTAASVWLLGAKPYTAVPSYLQHADALVVPHLVTAFTDSLDPIKLYEYLAVGRPVVATPVAGFRDQTGNTIAAGAEFAKQVRRLCAAPPLPPGPLPISVPVPTWGDRVEQMAKVLAAVSAPA